VVGSSDLWPAFSSGRVRMKETETEGDDCTMLRPYKRAREKRKKELCLSISADERRFASALHINKNKATEQRKRPGDGDFIRRPLARALFSLFHHIAAGIHISCALIFTTDPEKCIIISAQIVHVRGSRKGYFCSSAALDVHHIIVVRRSAPR
jgi:hypothetical protein